MPTAHSCVAVMPVAGHQPDLYKTTRMFNIVLSFSVLVLAIDSLSLFLSLLFLLHNVIDVYSMV